MSKETGKSDMHTYGGSRGRIVILVVCGTRSLSNVEVAARHILLVIQWGESNNTFSHVLSETGFYKSGENKPL